MKKNKLKKGLSLVLSVVMALGMSVATFAADTEQTNDDGSVIGGSGGSISPIYKFVLPGNVDFAVDAYEQTPVIAGSQISGGHYGIINKSNVGLEVAMDAYLRATDTDVKVVPYAEVPITGKTKEISIAIAPAKTVGINVASPTDPKIVATGTDYATDTDLMAFFGRKPTATGTDYTPANVTFTLQKANYTAATPSTPSDLVGLQAGDKGYTAFTFFGKVNPSYKWQANDVAVSLEVSIRGLVNSEYDGLKATDFVTGVKNVTNMESSSDIAPAQPQNGPKITGNAAIAYNGTGNVSVNYTYGEDAAKATKVTKFEVVNAGGTTTYTRDNPSSGNAYSINATTLTFMTSTTAAFPNAGVYKVNVYFNDPATTMLTWTVTRS